MKPILTYFASASVDGYIARPDGHVEWLEEGGFGERAPPCDALLIGRGAYDALREHWPLPAKPTILLTRHPPDDPPPQVLIRHCTPAEALAELARLGHRRVRLVGGSSLAGSCLAAGLLDELVINLKPFLLGAGRPLFASGMEHQLELARRDDGPEGIVRLHYRVLPR